jgi:protein-S-isoprenylcysteine O-methyltransferase Ste14
MKLIDVRPPVLALLYLATALGMHWIFPALHQGIVALPALGLACSLLGFGIALWSSWWFKRSHVALCPTAPTDALVTEGPYRFSRNPIYLGIILFMLGIALYMGSIPFYLATAAFFATIDGIFIPYEENKLEKTFGARYRDFKKRVRRWF